MIADTTPTPTAASTPMPTADTIWLSLFADNPSSVSAKKFEQALQEYIEADKSLRIAATTDEWQLAIEGSGCLDKNSLTASTLCDLMGDLSLNEWLVTLLQQSRADIVDDDEAVTLTMEKQHRHKHADDATTTTTKGSFVASNRGCRVCRSRAVLQ